jgi:type III secretion system YscD/HrpQ family protein
MNSTLVDKELSLAPQAKRHGRVALSVAGGLHDGATIDLPELPMCVVGSARHCDVILRDPSVAPEHVAITRDAEGIHVRALTAGFGYDERVIGPGDSIVVPSSLNDASIVLGAISLQVRQPIPVADETSAQAESAGETGQDESAPANSAPGLTRRRYGKPVIFGMLGLGGVLTCAAFALSVSESVHQKAAARVDLVRAALAGPQLAGVKVEERGSKILLSGFVANEDENQLLRNRLKPGMVDSMQVNVGTDLATRTKDLLRVNGHTATTSYQPHGKVLVALAGIDKQTQDRLADSIRKDLPMIASVQVTSSPTAAELARAAGPTCVNPDADRDGLKFVASFAGDHAFVRTANGNKYYVNSKLPTGHEISAIRESEIVLECVGKFTTISL